MPTRALVLVALAVLAPAGAAAAATPQIHAHRGGTVENGKPRYGEESLAAYKRAARNGFVLEVDAKLTEDGVPVAIHDATLDRTTTCTGEVRTFTVAELAGCRIDFPAGKPARIITIRSLLDYARRAGADREPRDQERPERPGLRLDAGIRQQGDGRRDREPHPAQPADHPELRAREPRRGRARLPGVATSLLSLQALNEAYLQLAFDKDYDIISPEWPVTADYVHRAHGDGLDVIPFTLDTATDVRAARAAKVDELITDDPLGAARAMGFARRGSSTPRCSSTGAA